MNIGNNSHWGKVGSEINVSLKRTTNPMSPVTNQIIPSRRTFSRGSRIHAGSMDLTNSTDPQEESQEGLITQ